MPTPSDISIEPVVEGGTDGHREWTANTDTPKRSVFGNYRTRCERGDQDGAGASSGRHPTTAPTGEAGTLQSAITLTVARSFVHRLLAVSFADPTTEAWNWLTDASTLAPLRSASSFQDARLAESAEALAVTLRPEAFDPFLSAFVAAFGHAARGACPLNEIEYGDIKADPLFQPHRLADLAAFYRAFGLEVVENAGERQDHLSMELEFMCVLVAKEAYALEYQLDSEELDLCRDAQRKFLGEHLGRWTPAFARRLAATTDNPTLRALADFIRLFVENECARFRVNPGSEDLLLRPVDEAADRMCDSCGLTGVPPGAEPVAAACHNATTRG